MGFSMSDMPRMCRAPRKPLLFLQWANHKENVPFRKPKERTLFSKCCREETRETLLKKLTFHIFWRRFKWSTWNGTKLQECCRLQACNKVILPSLCNDLLLDCKIYVLKTKRSRIPFQFFNWNHLCQHICNIFLGSCLIYTSNHLLQWLD